MSTEVTGNAKSGQRQQHISLSLDDLQKSVAEKERGLSTIYLPGEGFKMVEPDSSEAREFLPSGSQDMVNIASDLLLVRSDLADVPESAHDQSWELDYGGWLFLHFRLDGLTRETTPDGRVITLGGQSFLLSASSGGAARTREVLGDSWRTVGIACRPSFLSQELRVRPEDLPDELSRFQSGERDIEFWYAGELTNEMSAVAETLLQPKIHESVRPIYLRAKAVELVCLALDRLRQPEPDMAATVRLGRYDISCLHFARQILDESRKAPSLGALARRVGINRNKLAMGFKHVFGMPVGAYHREQRLVRAFHLLKKSDMTIGCIADEAGYRDAGSFSKAFKLRFGFLPSDLRSGRGKAIIQE